MRIETARDLDYQRSRVGELDAAIQEGIQRRRSMVAEFERVSREALPVPWQQWLASNLMKGLETSTLQRVLRENGFSDFEAAVAVTHASSHPYVEAGREIFKTVRKRNWLLKTCHTLAALDERYALGVERMEAPSFATFINDYYSKHLPVVLTGGIDHWPARRLWTPEYFCKKYGHAEVEVQVGRNRDPMFERNSLKHKQRMTMDAFVRRVRSVESSNDFYMTANNMAATLPHLVALFDDLGDFASGYRTLDANTEGCFLWFGPKGTFTPLHHDLTNNMLVQIYGRKKVSLVPALQVASLYNDTGVFSGVADLRYPDLDRYPLLKDVRPIDVEIGSGDALFIPVGWWHSVESLEVSVSVSFTDFKANNQFAMDFPR